MGDDGDDRVRLLVIVKLGGSAITHKATQGRTNDTNIMRASRAILAAREQARTEQRRYALMVVHGAGSFGHHEATKYGLGRHESSPTDTEANRWAAQGVAETRAAVTKLNHLVVERFVTSGIPAVGVSPFPALTMASGTDAYAAMCASTASMFHDGDQLLVPIWHGDGVAGNTILPGSNEAGDDPQGDMRRRVGILSGDVITLRLADCSRARHDRVHAVFLSDVDGVYNRPPEEEGAQLVCDIHINSTGKVTQMLCEDGTVLLGVETSTNTHDVTGGIATKIKAATDAAQLGVDVVIMNIAAEEADLQAAISGARPPRCTFVHGYKDPDSKT